MPSDWPATRRRIIARDKGICHLCGKPGANSVDHVKPAARGGSDDDSNLRAAHWICNRRKGARVMQRA